MEMWRIGKIYEKELLLKNMEFGDWVIYAVREGDKENVVKRSVIGIGTSNESDSKATTDAIDEQTAEFKLEDYDLKTKAVSNMRLKTLDLARDYEFDMPSLPVGKLVQWDIESVIIGKREILCEVLSGKNSDGKSVMLWLADEVHFRAGLVREAVGGIDRYRVVDFGHEKIGQRDGDE